MKNKIIKQIIKENKIAVFGHIREDGDSISSSYGLLTAIKSKFPKKEVVWVTDKKYIEEHFGEWDIDYSVIVESIDESFMTIVGDVSELSRIRFGEEFNKGHFKIAFDHHQNSTDLDLDLFWHEPTWSASSMQSYLLAKGLKAKFNEHVAFSLAVGILTDTGFFKYSLGSPQPPRIFSELLEYISDEKMNSFYNNFGKRTQLDLEVQTYMLNNIKYDGKLAYVYFDKATVKKFGEFIIKIKVNFIANIQGSPVWALFIDTRGDNNFPTDKDFPIAVSLRSNGPNVQAVAKDFNGGGHIRASGAKVKDKTQMMKLIKMINKK